MCNIKSFLTIFQVCIWCRVVQTFVWVLYGLYPLCYFMMLPRPQIWQTYIYQFGLKESIHSHSRTKCKKIDAYWTHIYCNIVSDTRFPLMQCLGRHHFCHCYRTFYNHMLSMTYFPLDLFCPWPILLMTFFPHWLLFTLTFCTHGPLCPWPVSSWPWKLNGTWICWNYNFQYPLSSQPALYLLRL